MRRLPVGVEVLRRRPWLLLLPLGVDAIVLALRAGDVPVAIAPGLPVAPPRVTAALVFAAAVRPAGPAVIYASGLVASLAVLAFVKGAFLGTIATAMGGTPAGPGPLVAGRRYWLRFLTQGLLLSAATAGLAAISLRWPGPLSLPLWVSLLLTTVFWDYALVVDDLGVLAAARAGLLALARRPRATAAVAVPLYLASAGLAGVAFHTYPGPGVAAAALFYAGVGTVGITAMMALYRRLALTAGALVVADSKGPDGPGYQEHGHPYRRGQPADPPR